VCVVFDSDVVVKPQVHQALSRFRGFLESRGAEVRVVYLPHGEGGKKQGVDDFFVAGHGVDDLLSHATTELRGQHAGEDEELREVYRATPDGIVWNKPTRDGTSPTPLTNFVAEIVSDVVEDDGAEERHTFERSGRAYHAECALPCGGSDHLTYTTLVSGWCQRGPGLTPALCSLSTHSA
jgi:Domain of unknown function (DUF3854)